MKPTALDEKTLSKPASSVSVASLLVSVGSITDADSPQRAAEGQSQEYTTLENTRFAPKINSSWVRGSLDACYEMSQMISFYSLPVSSTWPD